MNILLNCEESQTVTKAFRERGHKAFSCDILPCSGGRPEWHIQGDAFKAMHSRSWDMIIQFPPCTHLAVSGAKHFYSKRLDGRQDEAIRFFISLHLNNCPRLVTENSVGIMSGKYIEKYFPHLMPDAALIDFPRPPEQIIQPYMFGDAAEKRTCLWLRGVPLLQATNIVEPPPRKMFKSGSTMPAWYNLPPSEDRGKLRSKTFPGIAKAMAEQWG